MIIRMAIVACCLAFLVLPHGAFAGAPSLQVTMTEDRNDPSGEGLSLREAIAAAAPGQSIGFVPALNNAQLGISLGEIVIDKPLFIAGLGSGLGSGRVYILGSSPNRLFHLTHTSGEVKFVGLTLAYGNSTGDGGAILNDGGGTVTVRECRFFRNRALNGGAISVQGTGSKAVIERCQLDDNEATGLLANGTGFGGAVDLFNGESVLVNNSTITSNSAGGGGGGISSAGSGSSLTMVNCTVVRNDAIGGGGGLFANSPYAIGNTILSGNSVAEGVDATLADMRSEALGSTLGGNYIGVGAATAPFVDGTVGDQVGTSAAPLPLPVAQDFTYGGFPFGEFPTGVLLPLIPSRIVGMGNAALLTSAYFPDSFAYDQRRAPRVKGAVDIGAVEASPSSITVTTKEDEDDGMAFGTGTSLREAVSEIGLLGVVLFDEANLLNQTITLTKDELLITQPLTIYGPGPRLLTISGDNASRIFRVNVMPPSDYYSTIAGLTLSEASTTGDGGGVMNEGGNLELRDLAIRNCSASHGGGISTFSSDAATTISRCLITGNVGLNSSGGVDVYDGARTVVLNSTISGNVANGGGAVFSEDGTSLTILHSTVVDNVARNADQAGGIAVFQGAAQTIANTIIQRNSTTGEAAASDIRTDGSFSSGGGNYVGVAPASVGFNDPTDQVGTAEAPLAPSVSEALADNGGPTDTYYPLYPGPAVDAGTATEEALYGSDQRGSVRWFGPKPDSGAVEWSPTFLDGNPDGCEVASDLVYQDYGDWLGVGNKGALSVKLYIFLAAAPGVPKPAPGLSGTVAAWDYLLLYDPVAMGVTLYDADGTAIPPDPEKVVIVDRGDGQFEALVRKDLIGGPRTFVVVIAVTEGGGEGLSSGDGFALAHDSSRGPGFVVDSSSFLPIIEGYSPCTNWYVLRQELIAKLLGFQDIRRITPGGYYDTNGDARVDMADLEYLAP
jgi:hypothetical protein